MTLFSFGENSIPPPSSHPCSPPGVCWVLSCMGISRSHAGLLQAESLQLMLFSCKLSACNEEATTGLRFLKAAKHHCMAVFRVRQTCWMACRHACCYNALNHVISLNRLSSLSTHAVSCVTDSSLHSLCRGQCWQLEATSNQSN